MSVYLGVAEAARDLALHQLRQRKRDDPNAWYLVGEMENELVTAQPSPLGNGLDNDEWRFIPTDSGYYAIRNKNSGLVLAVQGAALTRGTPIVQSAYSGGNFNDEWLIQPVGNGLYNFVNRLSGLYLDVRGGSHNPGTQLIQWTPDGGANQQFSLVQDAPPGA